MRAAVGCKALAIHTTRATPPHPDPAHGAHSPSTSVGQRAHAEAHATSGKCMQRAGQDSATLLLHPGVHRHK